MNAALSRGRQESVYTRGPGKTPSAGVVFNNARKVFKAIGTLQRYAGMAAWLGMRQMPSLDAVAESLGRRAGMEPWLAHGVPQRGGVPGGMEIAQNLLYELTAACVPALRAHRVAR